MTPTEFAQTYYRDRSGTHAQKFTALERKFGDSDLTSMWVANMEFKTAQPIIDSLAKRVEHGIFGYSDAPDSYFEALNGWMTRHYGHSYRPEEVRVTPGIVPALYWFVNMFTNAGDSVILMPPVYYPFRNSVCDNGRKAVDCDLLYRDGRFSIDFDAFERKVVENGVKLFLLCSPHNPAGRVWSEAELDRLLGICMEHGVVVVADEIHQDITMPGADFIPAAKVSNGKYRSILVTANSVSKTFNLASLNHANVIITDDRLRRIYDDFCSRYYRIEPAILGYVACEAAYRYGEPWRQDLLRLICENDQYVRNALAAFPQVKIAPLEGTYLVFIDLREIVPAEEVKEFMLQKCRIACDFGEWFGEAWGGFVRLNIATHPDTVKNAIDRMKEELKKR